MWWEQWTCVRCLQAGRVWRRRPDCWFLLDSDRPRWSPDRQREAGSDGPPLCVGPAHTHTHTQSLYSCRVFCRCVSVCRGSTHLGGGEDPFLQQVGWGRSLMDGRRRAIGQDGGGGRQVGRGRAAGWINGAHDQLTLFRETEVAAGVRRHTAQLQKRKRKRRRRRRRRRG